MTPNRTKCAGSESTKHPKYPCNTVLPRCARRKGGRHIDVPCFTYLGGGGRNGRPPIHLNYSLSNRQGPVVFFSFSGSLIYHRLGMPFLIIPYAAVNWHRQDLSQQIHTTPPSGLQWPKRAPCYCSERNLSCRDAAILIGSASKSGATTIWIS